MSRQYEELYELSYEVRERFLEIFSQLGFGHVTSAFSWTEVAISLYTNVMHYSIDTPELKDRDRLVLSKGHGAGMLFPIYEKIGMITKEQVNDAIKIGGDKSVLSKFFYPGFDFYGGSLGMGLGIASGLAMGARLNREKWITFCVLGDAECYEGSVWEAAFFAGHNELNNIVVIVDRNMLGVSDFTENMLSLEPLSEKWKACNWDVLEVDGHSYEELIPALKKVYEHRNKMPICIIANTVKGKGLEYLYNNPLMHGFVPKTDVELSKALSELKHY